MVELEQAWGVAASLLKQRAAVGVLELTVEPHLRSYGLGMGEYLLLLVLFDQPALTGRNIDLAEKLGVTTGGVTRIVNRAVSYEYVERKTNPDDKRSALVTMTALGLQKLEAVTPVLAELATPLVGAR